MFKRIIEQDLARAEAVIHDAETRKLHEPTVDNFRGQAMAYRRVLALFDLEKAVTSGPITLNKHVCITVPWVSLGCLLVFIGLMIWKAY